MVALAYDGLSALEKAREFVPASVLLDLGLPGMDGYEVARRLRAESCVADALIIAITGYGQDEDRARSHAAGCDHHLVKPIDFGGLQELFGLDQTTKSRAQTGPNCHQIPHSRRPL